MREVAGVELPDSALCEAATELADACEHLVPGFERFNLCDVLLASAGDEQQT